LAFASAYVLSDVVLRSFNVACTIGDTGEEIRSEMHLIPNVIAAAVGERASGADGLRYRFPNPGWNGGS
jgi:UDP-glucose 4-epimerase